jgi:hypothetical protein
MAAVTAAVIGATATVAAGAMSSGVMSGGGGGGSSKDPQLHKIPMDPNDRAMRDYYARLQVANADTRYPSFGEFTQSGGDPSKALMDVKMPELKPSEAAALGFVGGKGEDIPGLSQADLASGNVTSLTNEQRQFLAKERAGQAAAAGQEPGPWAAKMKRLGGKVGRLENLLATKFTPTPEVEPRETKIQNKLTKLRGKLDTTTAQGDRGY